MKCELIYVSNSSGDSKDKSNPEFGVVQEFSANDASEAASFVKKYNSEHSDHTYYWRHKTDPIGIWHEDGICSYSNTIGFDFWGDADEFFVSKIAKLRKKLKKLMKDTSIPTFESFEEKHKDIIRKIARIRWFWGKKPIRLLVGMAIYLKDELEYYLWDKWGRLFDDISFKRRNIKSFKKTGHAISEHWGLGEHLLEDLKYNLKKLIEVKHGVSFQFINEVVLEEHKDEPGFDLDKWFEKNYEIPEEIHDKAKKRCNEIYQHIIDLIDKYAFYSLNGPEPEKEYPKIALEGSWNETDYAKMSEISKECWDEIWKLVSKYGQSMWD